MEILNSRATTEFNQMIKFNRIKSTFKECIGPAVSSIPSIHEKILIELNIQIIKCNSRLIKCLNQLEDVIQGIKGNKDLRRNLEFKRRLAEIAILETDKQVCIALMSAWIHDVFIE